MLPSPFSASALDSYSLAVETDSESLTVLGTVLRAVAGAPLAKPEVDDVGAAVALRREDELRVERPSARGAQDGFDCGYPVEG